MKSNYGAIRALHWVFSPGTVAPNIEQNSLNDRKYHNFIVSAMLYDVLNFLRGCHKRFFEQHCLRSFRPLKTGPEQNWKLINTQYAALNVCYSEKHYLGKNESRLRTLLNDVPGGP